MPMITVTEKALKEVKRLMAAGQMDPGQTCLRVGVKGGGCSGYTFVLNLDDAHDEKKDTVAVLEDGIKLVFDKRSGMYLDGVTLDFHEGIDKRGFIFDNPAATGKCGCGSSFSM